MSAPQKPRGGSDSELTKLKQLAPEKQEVIWSWRDENPVLTNTQIRNRLATQFGIRLKRDGQLSEFWRWFSANQELQQSNDLIEQFEDFTRTKNPDWTPDKVRDTAISFFMAHTVAKKDPDKFATIVKLEQGQRRENRADKQLRLDQQKFEFDAAKAALAKLPELNAIKRDNSLTEDAKLEQARLRLFGETPK